MEFRPPLFVIGVLALFLTAAFTVPGFLHHPKEVASLQGGLSSWELSTISAQIGKSDTAYHLTDAGIAYEAVSPTHHYRISFSSGGPVFTYASSSFGIALAGAPYGTATVAGNTISYGRGAFTEWYANGPLGIEQGFTFSRNPAPGQPLGLVLSLSGIASASVHAGGQGITLTTADGKSIEYQGLTAFDANHKVLPAEFDCPSPGIVTIRVEDTGAAYPVTIDPYVQEQKLTASDGAGSDYFGYTMSMVSDASRLAIGAIGVSSSRGAVYIFSRSGSSWIQEQKLSADDGQSADYFGSSISLSADGTRIAIGAYGAPLGSFQGAVYIFSRSGTVWSQEQKLTAGDGQSSDYFGSSVALAGDGSRVAIGAYGLPGNAFRGAAYVFSRSGTVWSQEQEIAASDAQNSDYFGRSMGISSDGSRLVVGAYGSSANSFQGAAYVFSRSGTVWSQEQKLTASDGASSAYLGNAISMTDDGSRVAVGAPAAPAGSFLGAAYVFSRSGTVWSQEQKLTASDGLAGDSFGFGISIAGDGSRVAVGASGAPAGAAQGAVYSFSRSGTVWSQEQKLTASDGASSDRLGIFTAISGDGSRIAGGAYGAPAGAFQGAAYIYNLSVVSATAGSSRRWFVVPLPPRMSAVASTSAYAHRAGLVTYEYTLTNPTAYAGADPITNVALSDTLCGTAVFDRGDDNHNQALDQTETWKYHCTAPLTDMNENTVTVHWYMNYGMATRTLTVPQDTAH